MDIQIVSDLHLEAPKGYVVVEIVPKAPYLALLGDVGHAVQHKDDFLDFLTRKLMQFRIVFFVPGNHEAYHSNWPDTLKVLTDFERETANDSSLGSFILLNRRTFRIPNTKTVILGCSLFSHIPSSCQERISFGVNDFYHIDDWDVNKHNVSHEQDLAWLNDEVETLEEDTKIMIFTHWSPSVDPRAVDPKHENSPIASAFATDLSQEMCFKSPNVQTWAFGHTHFNCDFEVDRGASVSPIRLLTNQRGYYFSQAEEFIHGKVIHAD